MRKLFTRRPSAGVVIGFIALCVALGGGAYAAKSKKVTYKGLDKDARLKVLPVSSTNANTSTTPCDPTAAGTFTDCTTVSVNGSSAFPRRYMLVFDGVFDGGGAPAKGECRLEVDNTAINGTKTNVHSDGANAGFGINIVTTPQGGQHTFSVSCDESLGDLKVSQYQLSAISVR
ncbi:MAG TPA: hypothetical protein VF052_01125 [Solirubrobacterales bacterium]